MDHVSRLLFFPIEDPVLVVLYYHCHSDLFLAVIKTCKCNVTAFQNVFYLNVIINIEVVCCFQYNYLCQMNFEIPNEQLSGMK